MQTGSPETNDTEMKNPPKKQTRMVKIKAKTPIRLSRPAKDAEGKEIMAEFVVREGETAEVTEAEAREFCDQAFDIGHKGQYFGNISPDFPKGKIVRAERVKELN